MPVRETSVALDPNQSSHIVSFEDNDSPRHSLLQLQTHVLAECVGLCFTSYASYDLTNQWASFMVYTGSVSPLIIWNY